MNKSVFAMLALLVVVIIFVPSILVNIQQHQQTSSESPRHSEETIPLQEEETLIVPVYLTREERVVKVPLEAYVRGVVAAEMPIEFHKEALKAQALAARTYIVEVASRADSSIEEQYGNKAKGAWVTDTAQHQVYYTDDQLKENWGSNYAVNMDKIIEAVNETRGKIITYDGQPIYAAFFSTSNGKTENSEDYWEHAFPYLRSVESPWDRQAPSYEHGPQTFTLDQFQSKLQLYSDKPIAIPASTGIGEWIRVIARTAGDNIASIRVGDETFTGRQIREALGLRSSDFDWEITGDTIAFTTRGYGHGVGMSQWGAHLMAEEGQPAEEIVQHYYRGVTIEDYDPSLVASRQNE